MALSRQEAVATLLHMCNKLGLDNATRFHALCLFADRLLPSLEEPGVHCYRPEGTRMDKLGVLAAVCVLLAMKQAQPQADASYLLRLTISTVQPWLGDLSTKHMQAAEEVVSREVPLERGLLVSDAVQDLHTRMSQGGMRAFSHVKLSTCYALLELLYVDPRYYGSLDAGGTLLAAGVVAAAMAVCCRPSDMTELVIKALMDWLADLSDTPKEIILIQAEQVLEHTLTVTKH